MSKFFTSFFDGLTGAGILGDLRLPYAPNRMFKAEQPDPFDILVIRSIVGEMKEVEVKMLRGEVEAAVNRVFGDHAKVAVTEVRERYGIS